MKETYSFFNSKDKDRVYNAKDWADYFFPFFRTGVFNGHLQIVENEGMSIKANPGYAWIDGYKYHLWDEGVLDLEMASGNMNRKDSIVVRLDHTKKWIRMFCKTGSYYAGTAIPPAPEISATIHEIVIAHISVAAGTTRITQSMIEDTRMDKTICGWVCGAVEQIDFSQITAQFETFFKEYRGNISDEFKQFQDWQEDKKAEIAAWQAEETKQTDSWQEEKKAEIDTWQAAEAKQTDDWQQKETEDFTEWVQEFVNKWESWLLGETKGWQEEIIDWFNNLREQITENAAVSLQEQIGNLNKLETEEKEDLVSAINSLALTYDETIAILAGVKTVTLTLSANDGASVEGKTVTLHNVATGEDTVMTYSGDGISFEVIGETEYILTVESMELHTTPEPLEIIVTDEDSLELNLEYRIMSLKDLSWAEINSVSESGKAGEVFNLHDTKEIELTTGEKVVLEIVGFDHDTLASDATKKAGITFGTKNSLTQYCKMNPTDEVRAGGWKTSEMRTVYIRERFYNVLPEELKAVIKQVNKNSIGNTIISLYGYAAYNVETTVDDVWLFSAREVGAERDLSSTSGQSVLDEREGTPYPALTDGDQYESARKKNRGTSGEGVSYFTRSIRPKSYGGSDETYECVWENGNIYGMLQYEEYGMVVGFCI